MKTYEDLNYASDADPAMWLDRRDAPCLIPEPVMTAFKDEPVKTVRVVLTPSMRKMLLYLRRRAGISQEQVGRIMGRTQAWVSQFETGAVLTLTEDAFNELWDLYHARLEGEAAG